MSSIEPAEHCDPNDGFAVGSPIPARGR